MLEAGKDTDKNFIHKRDTNFTALFIVLTIQVFVKIEKLLSLS